MGGSCSERCPAAFPDCEAGTFVVRELVLAFALCSAGVIVLSACLLALVRRHHREQRALGLFTAQLALGIAEQLTDLVYWPFIVYAFRPDSGTFRAVAGLELAHALCGFLFQASFAARWIDPPTAGRMAPWGCGWCRDWRNMLYVGYCSAVTFYLLVLFVFVCASGSEAAYAASQWSQVAVQLLNCVVFLGGLGCVCRDSCRTYAVLGYQGRLFLSVLGTFIAVDALAPLTGALAQAYGLSRATTVFLTRFLPGQVAQLVFTAFMVRVLRLLSTEAQGRRAHTSQSFAYELTKADARLRRQAQNAQERPGERSVARPRTPLKRQDSILLYLGQNQE